MWTLTASIIFNGTGSTWTETFNTSNIRFSEFSATLSTPADRTTEPGLTTTLNYWITNTGSQDDYFDIGITSTQGWADMSLDTDDTTSFSSGVTINIQIEVSVPSDAARTDIDTIVLTLTSVNDPNVPRYSLTATTMVMAGESYTAILDMPITTQLVVPGDEVGFNATIENDGNAPGSDALIAGFSTTSSRWSVRLGATTTAILNESDIATFSVNITVPPVKMPLDSADHNREADTLSVWVQAIPSNGGIPVTASTPLRVAPVIVVAPGLVEETIDLSVDDVIAAKNGNGVEIFRHMDIEVRHNLNNPLIATVDGLIEAGNMTFTPSNSGGFNEVSRWNASVSNESLIAMALGTTKIGALGVQGPDSDYPLAGILSGPVVASIPNPPLIPTLVTTSIERNISINVPSIQGADIVDKGPFDVPLGVTTAIPLLLENTGNDLTSYRLSIMDDLPDGWVTSVNASGSSGDTILDLSADVADYPISGNSHMRDFQLNVATDPQAEAYSIQNVNVKIEDSTSGLLIDIVPVSIRVGPYVNASLSPTSIGTYQHHFG